MRLLSALAAAAALVACGGGTRVAPTPPALPEPAVAPRAAPPTRLHYRLRPAQLYEINRQDSLVYESMGGGTPQGSDKTGLLLVRSVDGRAEVTLESIAAGTGTRLAVSSLDSARGARWEIDLGPSGPVRPVRGGSAGVLAEQVASIVWLLFPQLPLPGLTAGDVWSDSAFYSVRVDAFDASESAVRWSRATESGSGVRVEATERLTRNGTASQGGQTMSLSGSGERRITYDFSGEGLVTALSARDSLDLRVLVDTTGAIIPVRWLSTLTARLRGSPPR